MVDGRVVSDGRFGLGGEIGEREDGGREVLWSGGAGKGRQGQQGVVGK